MSFTRLKKVLCNFEFTYLGARHVSCGFYLGDTANPKAVKGKDYTPIIVCQSLKISAEQLANMLKCKYWDINRDKLEKAGIIFSRLEIYFYPPK